MNVLHRLSIDDTIVLSERCGAIGTAHLLRAARDGRIALLPLLPEVSGGMFKAWTRQNTAAPAVVLVGDDDHASGGPSRFPLALRVIRWAKGALIHAAGAERYHYEGAILAAETLGRVVIIECGTASVDAWIAATESVPHRLLVLPHEGVHPLACGRVH